MGHFDESLLDLFWIDSIDILPNRLALAVLNLNHKKFDVDWLVAVTIISAAK
jgi:hypothetical protein